MANLSNGPDPFHNTKEDNYPGSEETDSQMPRKSSHLIQTRRNLQHIIPTIINKYQTHAVSGLTLYSICTEYATVLGAHAIYGFISISFYRNTSLAFSSHG